MLSKHYGVPLPPPVEQNESVWFPGRVRNLLPPPRVVLMFHGAWEVVEATTRYGGLEHKKSDWMAATCGSDDWERAAGRYVTFMEEHYSGPFRALLSKLQTDPAGEGSDAPGYFVLSLTPAINCAARGFRVGEKSLYAENFRGAARCSGLVLGFQQVVNDVARGAVAKAIASNGETTGTVVRLLDRTEALNPCLLRDGVHLEMDDSFCREYALESFWGSF